MVLDFARVTPNPARDRVTVKLPREEPEEPNPPTAAHVEAVYRLLPSKHRLARRPRPGRAALRQLRRRRAPHLDCESLLGARYPPLWSPHDLRHRLTSAKGGLDGRE
jgi:hypothetical protein